jgi:hypothetical protein
MFMDKKVVNQRVNKDGVSKALRKHKTKSGFPTVTQEK